jgi:hypothetical protein
MSLIDLQLAKGHLRVDGDADDPLIALYLAAAEQSACDFIDRQLFPDQAALDAAVAAGTAGNNPMVATAAAVAAILLILGHLYENREDSVVGASAVELPMGSRALLRPYRTGMGA